ncbi:hypothetical protein BKA58DRAFT_286960, partial [Alternaria rosae]|uniref:uncharacterized protein n=1 Tax=Alternaria rosae TaxID=1187941 RepID=UPI001E8D3A8B
GMVMAALPSCGLRGLIKSLLSPQITTSDHAETSTSQYVCARKRYLSGRKGRTCVYRISGKHTGRDGRKVRLYTNVEGVDLDNDERQSFASIHRTMQYTKGCSPRQNKHHSSPKPDAAGQRRLKAKRLAVKPRDASNDGSGSRSEGNGIAPSRARLMSASSNEEWDVPRHLRFRREDGKYIFRKSYNESRSRMGVESTPILPSRRSRTAAANNTVKLVINPRKDTSELKEHESLDREQNAFRVSKAPGSPFKQPGLTPQESSGLVFGTSSK